MPGRVRNVKAEIDWTIKEALTRLTADRAHFSEVELLRFAAEEAQIRGIGISEVRLGVSEALTKSPDIVRLRKIEDDRQFTTREMLNVEATMLATVDRAKGNDSHRVQAAVVAEVLGEYPTLRAEQAEAVRHITLGEDSITCVNGIAGSGKTFMLRVARECFQREGLAVIGSSLAAKAAKTLEEGSAIESTHIHKLFYQIERGELELTPSSVLVLDEAGMVGTRTMQRLIAIVEQAKAKLVLVGDHRQLQAIDAGAPFRAIADRTGCAQLNEIVRQRDKWAKETVYEFADGQALTALERYAQQGCLTITNHREEAIERLVKDWAILSKQARGDTLIFAGTNLETSTLNGMCQQERLMSGELSHECVAVRGNELHVGDRVVFTRNKRALLVRNGGTGTVSALPEDDRAIRVRLDEGFEIGIDLSSYDNIELGYAVTTHKGQGQTVENAFVLAGGPMTDREITYVQSSRARGPTRIYSDILSGGESIEALARQMARSRAKDLAHEHLLEVS